MADYKHNKVQLQQMAELIDLVKRGVHPVVTINSEIFQECYLSNGMKAKIISVSTDNDEDVVDGHTDIVCHFKLDFSDYYEYNKKFDEASWRDPETGLYNLTSEEAGEVPKDKVESVFHSISHGKIFFDLATDENEELQEASLRTKVLQEHFRKSDATCDYFTWLEKTAYAFISR